MRPVRSYVLRQGRMSPAQHEALEAILPAYAVPYAPARLDLASAFGRDAPTILEIGSGMGETTVAMALAEPHVNFLAVEVHKPGVAALVRRARDEGASNVRVVRHDAVEVLRDMIAPASLAGIRIFFPDPWPKKRHHKRRLVQAPFVRAMAHALAHDAVLHIATDWEPYALEMLDTLSREPLLANCEQGFAARPLERPLTKFERRGVALGHGVWDLRFARA